MQQLASSVHPSAYLFVVIAIVGGVLAVSLRNVLHAIFCFALSLTGFAALFLYLGSPLVAAMELLIYAGGISVAMAFAVMFAYHLNRGPDELRRRRRIVAVVSAVIFCLAVGAILWHAEFPLATGGRDWSVEAIGRALLGRYNLVFEVLSVVLLLAIMGSIIIAREETDE